MSNTDYTLYMTDMIERLIDRLEKVIRTITSRTEAEEVTFDDAYVLALFYFDFQHTNSFIDEVEQRAHHDVSALLVGVTQLQSLINQFLSLNVSMWRSVDYQVLAKAHEKIFQEPSDAAEKKANQLWRKIQSESNRLDYMDERDEEYCVLRSQCDQTEMDYKAASAENDRLYAILRQEKDKCAHVYYFDFQFLELWATKMAQITEAAKKDAQRLIEEGRV